MPFGSCYQEQLDNSSFGLQRNVVLTQGTGVKTADNVSLINAGALADGTYYLRVCVGGTSKLNLQLKATFAGGSVTTSATTTFAPRNNEPDDALFLRSLQAFAGTGAMVSTTLQTSTIAAMQGEQLVVVKIVVAGGAAPVFTQAEINGPR